MYDPIFSKSFSRYDRRRFGCFALLFSFLIALTIFSTFKPTLHPLTLIGDAVSLHLSIDAIQDLLIDDDITYNPNPNPNPTQAFETSSDVEAETPEKKNVDNNTLIVSVAKAEAEAELPREEKIEVMNPHESSNEAARNTAVMSEQQTGVELPQLDDQTTQTILLINNTVVEAEAELPHEEKTEVMYPREPSNDAAQNMAAMSEQQTEVELPQLDDQSKNVHESKDAARSILVLNNTAAEPELETGPQPSNGVELDQEQKEEPLCRVLKANADYCEIEGDVRVDANTSTIFLIRPRSSAASWTIQPYPRKGIAFVKKWTVRVAAADGGGNAIPKCTQNHPHPALLFSIGGFTGNHFHDFADLLFPLFTTSFHFQRNVHLLAADNKPWWLNKYRPLLHRLTRHDILDTDHDTRNVHCYSKLTAGLLFHRELVVDSTSGVSMSQFRQLLRRTYSLERKTALVRAKGGASPKPRLMIVSRQRTRILINEDQVSRLARKLGYEVVSAESDVSTNLTKFAQLVNSCDVMMGVHGAGLTNMVFLPEKAVLIQVVPLGAIDIFAKLDFGDPSAGMNIRYLDYKIGLKESSLLQRYPMDHPVIKDPLSIHKQGWEKLRQVYLHNQNVTIDVARFKPTLAKALRLLRS